MISIRMNDKFLKPYNPGEVEGRIYELWEKSGYFNPDNLPPRHEKPFTIVMPPPNANGDLHAGHSLVITIEDIITRFKRMRGYKALWIPGADHAGFETQVVYEKKLEKEGRSRFGMDPQELYKEIYKFTLENKHNMENQIRALGASCDWSREKFTLDPDVVKKTQKTFVKMFEDSLIYRGKRTINWCSKHQTSLSEVETESSEEITPFYYFKYGPFEIGTVRPETKFADKYVVMHPDDARYSQYKHGDTFEVEWINGPIMATVIKDEAADMEFGTGVMTITPWHSQIDYEIRERHGLDAEQIIDWRGKLLPIAGEFVGMNIKDARPKIVERLKEKGLLLKVDENYKNVVKRCYKCSTIIEPQIKDQWFVKMEPLAKKAIESVDNKNIRFIPDNYEKIFRYWMNNTIDWNISRQIVWGIPIPAWFHEPKCIPKTEREKDMAKCKEIIVSEEEPICKFCDAKYIRDPDTFDTWFSSGQWPLFVTDYPDGKDFKTYYPTDVMETGQDLIFKWIPRMVIFGLYLSGKDPFHTIYLNGMVNDAHGKKMSKSKGNVINPTTLTEKYGTDALRMALVVGNTPATDLSLREDKVKGYKNFANKLWNIARFTMSQHNEGELKNSLVEEFNALAKDVTTDMDNYRFYLAAEKIYAYIWHRLADEIIEESKKDSSILPTTYYLLQNCLKLLHPFMPFITEEIWQELKNKESLLMIETWPT
ncbi:MAG: valine--tRNA ligase [Candidatus Zambryskibacteria bacterium]|nr:valine--tRNA ligase [Candidatus Zambryskibacteria bacterium]